MEKIINAMPSNQDVKADKVLEINVNHPIALKLKSLYKDNKDMLNDYAKVLYAQALLMDGMSIDNPSEICDIVLDYLSK
jgi:molecular chaperone HtpG